MSNKYKSSLQKDWFTCAELAKIQLVGLYKNKNKIIAKALKEGWIRRPRNAQGGGYEYHIDSLPNAAKLDLLKRRGKEFQAKGELTKAIEEVKAKTISKKANKKPKNELTIGKELTNIPSTKLVDFIAKASNTANSKQSKAYIKKLNTAKAREIILNKIAFLQGGRGFKASALAYTKHYNSGLEEELIEETSIYKYIKSISYPNLKRWKLAKQKSYEQLLPKEIPCSQALFINI